MFALIRLACTNHVNAVQQGFMLCNCLVDAVQQRIIFCSRCWYSFSSSLCFNKFARTDTRTLQVKTLNLWFQCRTDTFTHSHISTRMLCSDTGYARTSIYLLLAVPSRYFSLIEFPYFSFLLSFPVLCFPFVRVDSYVRLLVCTVFHLDDTHTHTIIHTINVYIQRGFRKKSLDFCKSVSLKYWYITKKSEFER